MPRERTRGVVIVGTSHSIQMATKDVKAQAGKELQDFLIGLCRTHGICAVAEELSAEALAQYQRVASIPMQTAELEKIKHRFCDPDNAERVRLGICLDENLMRAQGQLDGLSEIDIASRIATEHAKRERYWLAEIQTLNQWPILFICGANHVGNFRALLEQEGFIVFVAAADWASNGIPHANARKASRQARPRRARAGGRGH